MSHIKIKARVRELTEDNILEGVEPEKLVFIWATKYIPLYDIQDFYQLEGTKTVIVRKSGTNEIIREKIDEFASRFEETRKQFIEESIEDDLELDFIEDEETEESEE